MSSKQGPSAEATTALKCDLASEVLSSFGTLRFAATGWSMLPTIWPGDTLMVDRVAPDQVQVGDVVLVGRDGRLCSHRVVSGNHDVGNRQWITQGDAMPAPDRPVSESELLGRVAYIVRNGKLVSVPAEMSVVERLTAKIVRHSIPAARTLVYLHSMVRTPGPASGKSVPEKSVLSCQA